MKLSTPFGVLPFEFRRVELRDGGVVVVGAVAGVESGVVVERRDLAVAVGLVAFGAAVAAGRRKRRST